MGAALALIFSETDYRKAFFLGVSLPALIAAAQTQVGGRIPSAAAPTEETAFLQFIPTAHAQQTGVADQPARQGNSEGPVRSGVGDLELTPRKSCPECAIWFYDKNGQFLQKQPFPDQQGTFRFGVPQGTTQFGVWNNNINPRLWGLPENPQVPWSYEFDYESSIWNDFRRGLGNRNIKPYNPEISPRM